MVFTDGLSEVTNDKDEEFGLAALNALIASHAGGPLAGLFQAVVDATNRHGRARMMIALCCWCDGGERGIRTLDRVSPIHAFQACAFNHSAISPAGRSSG
jgi:Stage II sporulation protein E (SpoIIE)